MHQNAWCDDSMNPWNLCDNLNLAAVTLFKHFYLVRKTTCLWHLFKPCQLQPLWRFLSATVWNSAQGDRFHFLWLLTICCFRFASVPPQILYHSFWNGSKYYFWRGWLSRLSKLSHLGHGNIDYLDHPWCYDVLLRKGNEITASWHILTF